MTSEHQSLVYVFGECELDVGLHELRRNGSVCAVEPQVFDLLLYLIENRDRLVSKDEINERIWDGRFVSDAALTTAIKLARQIIGDSGKRQDYIRTFPRRGFRFVGSVENLVSIHGVGESAPLDIGGDGIVSATPSQAVDVAEGELMERGTVGARAGGKNLLRRMNYWIAAALAFIVLLAASGFAYWSSLPVEKPSIAVLPFENLGNDPEQAFFADGMAEDIITDLSKLSGLLVIARNSSFVYRGDNVDIKKVGRELGVRYLLEGSVRRSGDWVRINAQLIDVKTGSHLWAERYDGTMRDVFTLQDDVTKKIVGALAIKLTAEEQSQLGRGRAANPQAHDAFLRGWSHFRRDTPEDLAEAIPYLKRALELDPAYHRVQATLAAVYWRGRIRGEASRAAYWQAALGLSQPKLLELTRQYLQKSMLAPVPLTYQVASGLLVRQGKFAEAITDAKRGIALDGNDPAGYEALASALIYAGRPAESIDVIRKAMRLDPRNQDRFMFWLGLAQFGMEQFDQAVSTSQAVTQRSADHDLALIILASSYGHLGRDKEARYTVELVNRVRGKLDAEVAGSGLRPGIDISLTGAYTLQDVDHWLFKERKDRERLRLGLQKAGVPYKGKEKSESPISIAGATTVDAKEAKVLFDRGAEFIDVRGNLYNLGHIPGAKHLYIKNNFNKQSLAIVDKNEEAVIYCNGPKCLLSSKACVQAVSWGYKKIFYFRNGFPAWKAAGYPVEVSK